jgi:uncharacterized phage protein (TIGR01671 family)
MNREIKFRVWHGYKMWDDKEAKRLLYNEACECKLTEVICMEFTGLHDKNGKEIYEGDVLKPITNYLYKFGNYGQIEYEADYGGYICIGEYSKNQHHERLGCDLAFECEIIGNIHQNPDLLK